MGFDGVIAVWFDVAVQMADFGLFYLSAVLCTAQTMYSIVAER